MSGLVTWRHHLHIKTNIKRPHESGRGFCFWFIIVPMTVVKEQKVHPIGSMLVNSWYKKTKVRKIVKLIWTIIKEIYSTPPPPLLPKYHTFTVRTLIWNCFKKLHYLRALFQTRNNSFTLSWNQCWLEASTLVKDIYKIQHVNFIREIKT